MNNSLAISQPKKNKKARLSPTVVIFSSIGLILILCAILAPWIGLHNPNVGILDNRLKPPFWQSGGSLEFPLGTDTLGRDILTRIIYGARTTLTVCALVVITAGSIGTFLGIIAGYIGGWADIIIMRAVDLVYSLPAILLTQLTNTHFHNQFHPLGRLCPHGEGRNFKSQRV
jgi:peptide/nickel transport system permease protein